MKALPIRPQPVPGEPLADYIERLAEANDWTASGLLQHIKRAGPDHAESLAVLAGCKQLPTFSLPRAPSVDIPAESWGLPQSEWTSRFLRICPCCMEEAAWVRPFWRIKLFTACPDHRLALLHACPRCDELISWRSAIAGRCACGLRHQEAARAAEPAEVHLTKAIADGWQGLGEMVLGDTCVRLSMAQWIKVVRWVGSLYVPVLPQPGRRSRSALHVDDNRRRALCVASVLMDWPNPFLRYLQDLAAAAPAAANLRELFSPAYAVVHRHLRDRDFQFLTRVFQQVVAQHWRGELCRRNKWLAPEMISEHRFQALAKVARQSGVSRVGLKRMVDCAVVTGYRAAARQGAGREVITLDPADVDALMSAKSGYRCLKDTALLLGLKRSRLRQFVALGILVAEAHPEWDRSSHWFFSDQALRGFFDRLRGQGSQRTLADSIPFKRVLRYWELSPEELLAMFDALFSATLDCRMPQGMNIAEMRLERGQAHQWLQDYRDSVRPWLTPTQVAAALKLKEAVVYELIDRRLIAAETVPGNRGAFRRVDRSELGAFSRNYVSLAALAKLRGVRPSTLLSSLDVQPVVGPSIDGARQYFFRRIDLHRAGLGDLERGAACPSSEVVI